MRRRPPLALRAFFVAAVIGFAGTSLAQSADLPDSIVCAISLKPEDRTDIEQFVSELAPKLSSKTPSERQRARKSLQQPLQRSCVSVAFRLEYARTLVPMLETATRDPDPQVVLQALYTAGPLATESSVQLLLQSRTNTDPSLRLAAVKGLRDTLDSIALKPPAVGAAIADRILAELAEGIRKEADAKALDEYVLAMIAGTRVEQTPFESAKATAFRELSRGMGERIRAFPVDAGNPPASIAALRAGTEVRDILALRPQGVEAERPKAVALAIAILDHTRRRIDAGSLPVSNGQSPEALAAIRRERSTAVQLATVGETVGGLLIEAATGVKGSSTIKAELDKATTEGDRMAAAAMKVLIEQLEKIK